MPAFIGMFGGMLLSLVGGLVGRVLASLGMSLVTFYGMTQAIDFLKGLSSVRLKIEQIQLVSGG